MLIRCTGRRYSTLVYKAQLFSVGSETRFFRCAYYFLIYLCPDQQQKSCCATTAIPMYRHGLSLQIWVYYSRNVTEIFTLDWGILLLSPRQQTRPIATDHIMTYFQPAERKAFDVSCLVCFVLLALMNIQEKYTWNSSTAKKQAFYFYIKLNQEPDDIGQPMLYLLCCLSSNLDSWCFFYCKWLLFF